MSDDTLSLTYLSPHPILLVLSGPSGAGKDAVLSRLRRQRWPYHFVVTATTRPRRPREQDGIHYHFLATAEFQRRLAQGELLEHAQVYGNWYGVPRAQVREALQCGLDVIVKVDVQGAETLKGVVPQAVFVFIAPPSPEELEARLRRRHTEDSEALNRRLQAATKEMEYLSIFDYVVVNETGRLKETVRRIQAIITAERCRVPPRVVEL